MQVAEHIFQQLPRVLRAAIFPDADNGIGTAGASPVLLAVRVCCCAGLVQAVKKIGVGAEVFQSNRCNADLIFASVILQVLQIVDFVRRAVGSHCGYPDIPADFWLINFAVFGGL